MKSWSDYIAYILLACCFFFFAFLAFASEGSWGGADSVVHYRIARWAFKYPHLFLDLWGKPLFTILSAPFAQLGYSFMKLFNVLAASLTAFFAWKTLKILKIELSYTVIPAVLFVPIYFTLIPSAMTELLFGLVVVASIYYFFREKYVWSAVLISFLPFARNEGFIIIPLFVLAYILKKNYKAIPFIFSAFLFFSIIGWKHFNSFFWILKNNPYTGDNNVYGHGELLHFVKYASDIFGWPVLYLAISGILLAVLFIIIDRVKDKSMPYFLGLVAGSALIYFSAHSFVWWRGMGNSLGLTRVMACISPLVAMVSVYALSLIPGKEWVRHSLAIAAMMAIITVPLKRYDVPFQLDETDKLIKQTSEWLRERGYDKRLVYYYNPLVCHFMKVDPYDSKKTREQLPNRERPEELVSIGAIVVWDAHFGPNEGHMPIEKLKLNPSFKEIYHLQPEYEFTVLNGYKYEIFVFERI